MRFLRLLVLTLLLAAPRFAHAAAVASHVMVPNAALNITVTMTSDPSLTLDSNNPGVQGPTTAYVYFQITNNSATAATNLTVTLSGFGTNPSTDIVLGGSTAERAAHYIGSLAPGASRTVFWMLGYPATFGVSASLTATVSDGTNSASGSGTVTTKSMLSAQAAGVANSSTIGPGAIVGQIIPLTVTFTFKGWGAGDTFDLQPNGNPSFPAGCFEMDSTYISAADANLSSQIPPGTKNLMFFTATSKSNGGSSWNVTIVYYFKYLCVGSTGTPFPYSNGLSGTQLKYSSGYGSGGGNPGSPTPAPSPSGSYTVAKSAANVQIATPGDSALYSVTITNTSSYNGTIDSIADVLPSGGVYRGIASGSDITTANSGAYPSAGATGNIVFKGNTSWNVAAGGTLTLKYYVKYAAAGEYTNSATAYVATTTIGNSGVIVDVGTADVSVTKSAVTTAVAGDTIAYTLTVSNAGPNPAYRITVTDTLPSGTTFVSATGSGTLSGSIVTWPVIASLASGANTTYTLKLLAPMSVTSITNVAAGSPKTYDPSAANNNGSATASRPTTSITSSVTVTPDGLPSPQGRLPGTKYSETYTVSNVSVNSGTYAMVATKRGSPVFITVDSMTSPTLTLTRPRADSVVATLAAKTSASLLLWYTVANGTTATDTAVLKAQHTLITSLKDTGFVNIKRGFPQLALSKSISPSTGVLPGTALTYTITMSDTGAFNATGVALRDSVPAEVAFKVGSPGASLPAGVTFVVTYSNDNGATFTYTPVSGGCSVAAGYDGCVNAIKWTLTGAIKPTDAASTFTWQAIVR